MKLAALVTAAGSSQRFGTRKKEYVCLDDTPLLVNACKAFFSLENLDCLVLVCPAGDEEYVCSLFASEPYKPGIRVLAGGASRQESVFKGLLALCDAKPDSVMIHDGARPFLRAALLEACVDALRESHAVIPVVPSVNAVKLLGDNNFIQEHLDRDRIVQAQTPQCFFYDEILHAHKLAVEEKYTCTDDSEIYQKYIGPVKCISGDIENIKVTYPSDLEKRL